MRTYLLLVALVTLLASVPGRDPAPLPAAPPGTLDAIGGLVPVLQPVEGHDLRLSVTPPRPRPVPGYHVPPRREATVNWTNVSNRPVWVVGFAADDPLHRVLTRASPAAPWRDAGPFLMCGTGLGEHPVPPGAAGSFAVALPAGNPREQAMVSIRYTRLPPTRDLMQIPPYVANTPVIEGVGDLDAAHARTGTPPPLRSNF